MLNLADINENLVELQQLASSTNELSEKYKDFLNLYDKLQSKISIINYFSNYKYTSTNKTMYFLKILSLLFNICDFEKYRSLDYTNIGEVKENTIYYDPFTHKVAAGTIEQMKQTVRHFLNWGDNIEFNLISYRTINSSNNTYADIIKKCENGQILVLYLGFNSLYIVNTNTLYISDSLIKNDCSTYSKYISNNIILTNRTALLASCILNRLKEQNLIDEEDMSEIINIEENASIDDILRYSVKYYIENTLDIYIKTLQPIIIKEKVISYIKTNAEAKVTQLQDTIRDLESQYQEALNNYTQAILQCNHTKSTIEEQFEKLEILLNRLTNMGQIRSYNLDTSCGCFTESINTGFLPIIFIDKDILEATLKNHKPEKQKILKDYIDNKVMFYTTPGKLIIQVNLNNRTMDWRFNQRDQTLRYNNGHTEYSCLGTFKLQMSEAANNFNLAMLTSLFIQYLQSVSPADVAGKKALENLIAADENGIIVCADSNPSLIGENINEIQ